MRLCSTTATAGPLRAAGRCSSSHGSKAKSFQASSGGLGSNRGLVQAKNTSRKLVRRVGDAGNLLRGSPSLIAKTRGGLVSDERAHVQACFECCMGYSSSCVGLDGTAVTRMAHAFRTHLEAERALRKLQGRNSVLWQMDQAAH